MRVVLIILVSLLNCTLILANEIKFKGECLKSENFVLLSVGDVLLHSELHEETALNYNGSFIPLWSDFENYIDQANLSIANLEGPSAFNEDANPNEPNGHLEPSKDWGATCYKEEFYVADEIYINGKKNYVYPKEVVANYSGYPLFNYHPDIIEDLSLSGFDVLTTANNHSLDRRKIGADKTILALEKNNMHYVGTKLSTDFDENKWIKRIDQNGFKLSLISCTEHLNGQKDHSNQVLKCFDNFGKKFISQKIKEESAKGRFVIILPHWGKEFSSKKSDNENIRAHDSQRKFAQYWLNSGAGLILGNHSHAIKEVEKYITTDQREGFIVYSMGNFVASHYATYAKREATGLFFINLKQENDKSMISSFKFMPASMVKTPLKKLVPLTKNDSINFEGYNFLAKAIGEENFIYEGESLDFEKNCKN